MTTPARIYTPDRWCLFHAGDCTKVFATWLGSYLQGSSWRSNSGIDGITETDDHYLFHGLSGSVYECRKDAYGLTAYGASVLSNSEREPMDEEEATKWINEHKD